LEKLKLLIERQLSESDAEEVETDLVNLKDQAGNTVPIVGGYL
jgi:hypothetical protein